MKLTRSLLKKIVLEEMGKFGDGQSVEDAAKDTEEVDADEYADTLEKQIDFVKSLKLEENRLVKRLAKVQENKTRILKRISRTMRKI